MRIGLISDTHDKLPTIESALAYFRAQEADVVIHCGDWKSLSTVEYFASEAAKQNLPVRGVLGNNDRDVRGFLNYASSAPGDFQLSEGVLEIPIGDQRLAAHHGHHKPTLRRLLSGTYAVIALGHSHKPLVEQLNGTLVVNPGSTAFAIPRSKDWRPSVAIVDTAPYSAQIKYLA